MHTTQDLHVCGSCRRPFVVPQAVLRVLDGRDEYCVELACADCGWSHVGTYAGDALEALDRELDRGQAEIHAAVAVFEAVEELMRIDRFAAALHADLILPEDF
jgi:hypothetical protein